MWIKGRVTDQSSIVPGYYRLRLRVPVAFGARPGQFAMIRAWDTYDPLLPRPFSFHRLLPEKGEFEILYKVRGRGTELMTRLSTGDEVYIRGPLGNGFEIPHGAERIAVVARGIGIAPMLALAEEAAKGGVEVQSFLSAKTRELLLAHAELEKVSAETFVLTDDMPEAKDRLVTDMLAEVAAHKKFDAVYVCGSRRLTRAVASLEMEYGFRGYVAMESHMACGTGACKGCICKVRGEDGEEAYKYVCKDGPVFPVRRVVV
ncbi:MAG TPA: dihydroorotate dehydrogenase electron transfer subunit [Firmicutes bacterium]|nr:dihydroorotate dehydrogenase electron transfer subunit [Bacillota bacterium]